MPIKKFDFGSNFKELPIRFNKVACVKRRIKARTEKKKRAVGCKRLKEFYNDIKNIVVPFIGHMFFRMKKKGEFKHQCVNQQ